MKDKKYMPLSEYLLHTGKMELKLTFSEIEEILGFPLDASAFLYREFWANCSASTKAYSWMDAGYEITDLNLAEKVITFKQKNWI